MRNDSPGGLHVREHVTADIEQYIAVSGEHVLDHCLCSMEGVEEVTMISVFPLHFSRSSFLFSS